MKNYRARSKLILYGQSRRYLNLRGLPHVVDPNQLGYVMNEETLVLRIDLDKFIHAKQGSQYKL